jgi:hypothetical protein
MTRPRFAIDIQTARLPRGYFTTSSVVGSLLDIMGHEMSGLKVLWSRYGNARVVLIQHACKLF